MADRAFLWGGRSAPPRRATEQSGRRRHDQQRLLVELELDDSLYQGTLQAGIAASVRRATHAADTRMQPSYSQGFITEPKPRLQSRDAVTKSLTERHKAKRLLSPYKLKQQVLGTRNDPTPHRHQQKSPHSGGSAQRAVRSAPVHPSPAQLVIDSVRQNIHLRDQVIAHVQQELMGVLPLHRASHVEKNVPQRVVKLLNRMRSLSLAVVEAVVYLSSELGESNMAGVSIEHEILEQDFYGYLLQMASSDTDFLACSPPLQRFFEDFEVNLTRNPFVDGLSLDSSEVLLCSCHQSAPSGALFCSASTSSSSLLRLLTQKLETFALQTQRYLPGWQILPAERVAAALLHLMDLETRLDAVRMLPRYLQSHNDSRSYLYQQQLHQNRGLDGISDGYGTFQDKRIQRLDRQASQAIHTGGYNPHMCEKPVMEAWAGSPTANPPVQSETRTIISTVADPRLQNTSLPSSRKLSGSDDNGELTRLELPLTMLDTAATAKTSNRSSLSGRSVSKKKSRAAKDKSDEHSAFVDVSERRTSTESFIENGETLTTKVSVRSTSAGSIRDEAIQDYEVNVEAMANEDPRVEIREVAAVARSPASITEGDGWDPLVMMTMNDMELETLPHSAREETPALFINGDSSGVIEISEVGINAEAEATNDDGYEDDFEYSSNEALSSIAMALQMLPNFSLSNVEASLADAVSKPEEVVPPIEPELETRRTESFEACVIENVVESIVTISQTTRTTQYEAGESVPSQPKSVEQRTETPPAEGEDDEYTYSSSIAMALSLLPSVRRDDIYSVPTDQPETQVDIDSLGVSTLRSIEDEEEPWQMTSRTEFSTDMSSSARTNIQGDQASYLLPASSRSYNRSLVKGRTANSFPVSARSTSSMTTQVIPSSPPTSRNDIAAVTYDELVHSTPASSRSNISAASYQGDDEGDPSEFHRIFALCRDIQVAAYDMSHWVSQREVEDHIQSVAQPFSSLMGYSSPTTANTKADNAPKYLERELKMLRRNFASWKVWCVDQKRAKLVVRRLVARRKVRRFILHHHRRRLQARIDEENRLRRLAASRIQRNWRIYCHNQDVVKRKGAFQTVHMAFHRALFFVGVSRRRARREFAKNKVVRWWRRQRLRIKKAKRLQEKLARERERRARALRDIQRFLKEILLRRKLKAAQEMTKNIMFKEQLKWTKAKRDMKRTMMLNAKHRRELIAEMNEKLADLDQRWKVSEEERLELLTHHGRVVQQQQYTVEVRRRKLAALKIQMFFRVCLLHKKLQQVETEKKYLESKLRDELHAKEKLDTAAQKRVSQTRTQVRVLERKLGRMSQLALQTETRHREIVEAHRGRERDSREHVARHKIKAFIDARVLCRRADSERRKLLLGQIRLLAEKAEIELMSNEDQQEQRRIAISNASGLHQRLSELEAKSDALLAANNQLVVEKEQEAQQVAAALRHSKVEASMQTIASWASGQMKLSKFKKEAAAFRASAAREMEDEKQRQRKEIEAKMHEVESIKASNVMHQCISQRRNQKTVEMIRLQQHQKSVQEKAIARSTRAQLVQLIIDVKLLAECECNKGISQGIARVSQFSEALRHKFARLKHLRNMNCARKIQRGWCQWIHDQNCKRAQELTRAYLEEAKWRHDLARRLQLWWRKCAHKQQQRREQQRQKKQLVFNAKLDAVRRRANARKIQGVWRQWVKRDQEQRQQQQQLFEERLAAIRVRAHARKIQGAWRRWIQHERQRKLLQQIAFAEQLEAIRLRVNARKIQSAWRKWVQHERDRRHEQKLAFEARLEVIRTRANVRKIQRAWRTCVKCKQELQERRRVSVLRIQSWWRWQLAKRERKRREARRNHSAKIIQRCWEKWQKEKREADRVRNTQILAAIRIQQSWRQWQCKRKYEKEKARKRRRRQLNSARIQIACCQWWLRKLKERKAIRAVKRIQRAWRQWRQRLLERAEREREEKEQRAIALRMQQNWTKQRVRRDKEEIQRKQGLGAQRIQRKWRRWHRVQEGKRSRSRKEHRTAAVLVIQTWWRKVRRLREEERVKLEKEQSLQKEDERLQQEYVANALKIQAFWRKEKKRRGEKQEIESVKQTQNASSVKIQRNWGARQHHRKMERERIQHEQHMAALKIQTLWLKWYNEQQEELERERIQQEQHESSFKIERSWGISQQRRKMDQERLRHRQNINALKIQKHWRRWRHLRLKQRHTKKIEDAKPQKHRSSLTAETQPDANQLLEQDRQQKLDGITHRSHSKRIVRAVRKYLQNRREQSAATKIEAIWKAKLYRTQYLQVLEMKRAEEVRHYQMKLSVFATKVQVYWRKWRKGVRQARRALVKAAELRLIQETKILERNAIAAKRALAAKRIQRALFSRRKLLATKGVSLRVVDEKEYKTNHQDLASKEREENPVNQPHNEPAGDAQELSSEPPENGLTRASVETTVDDWTHRELPHIFMRGVNQVLFCHKAACVLQKFARECQSRLQMHFYFQHSFAAASPSGPDKTTDVEHFHFYFKRASAWLDWDVSKTTRSVGSVTDTNRTISLLRLRLDSHMTRKLLELFEPSEEYLASEILHVLQEIATDTMPTLLSPVCLEDNGNARPELRYHDVEEMELPLSAMLLREMGQDHAQIRRQRLLEGDTSFQELSITPPSPVAKSVPSSPSGRSSAPSSPSQRAKKEVTIFTAVENASVDDATFLQLRGADFAAVEPKTQRNALHMLSFSKENYRSRADMLEFLLRCDPKLDVNAVDSNGDTPLMLYASLGHLEFMQKLLEHGADIQKTNSKGQNVLHRACDGDQLEICGFLQQLLLKDSIAENIIPAERIAALCPIALTLHTPDNAGRYPLHCLAEKGFVECMKQLVVPTKANYDWNCILQAQGDYQGRTALHLAVLTHDIAMTTFLLTPGGGANVNAFDDLHRSPVHYAVESPAALPIISRLMQHGANLNVADERGDTPLHWAAFSGRAAVAHNLLSLGADPTFVNSDWETPAQIAAAYGQLDCMRLLLQAQRRYGAATSSEPREQQQQRLIRPASEKTALERLEEAVSHLHQRQALAQSCLAVDDEPGPNGENRAESATEQSHRGYWEELHQDVQLVEESGQFSSEDEEDLRVGHGGDDDDLPF